MLIKTKAKSALKMLITLFLTLALILGIYFAIPKQSTKVSAATTGSSAILLGYTSVTYDSNGYVIKTSGSRWLDKLASPVTYKNITSIRITTDSSKITDFTQGVNVKDDTSENDLYYYYKANSDKYDIVIYADVEKIYAPVCCYHLFNNLTNCKSIVFDNFNTSNVTNMSSMFYGCSSLTSLNLSSFNTSNVTNMYSMFSSCSKLTSLDLTNFDTSNVTNMYSMFSGCSKLTSLNVTNFDTSNVTDMSSMFAGLQSLKTLDISNFSFASITSADNIEAMLGISDAQFGGMLGLEGDDLDNYLSLSFEEKVAFVYERLGGEASEEGIREELSLCSSPSTIIAPATIPDGLEISLPGTYEYKDDSGNTSSTDILKEGKTHTLAGASTDTSETGVISDSILLSLIALCFVFSGFVMLKRKKVR